ncbi:hypothetical protein [Mariprofundus micogutta]|nr:hypothetical protein [Mariprofundus micogutta]
MSTGTALATASRLEIIKRFIVVFLLLSLFGPQAHAAVIDAASSVEPAPAKFRFTYDNVTLPANEKMGFLGATLLFDLNDYISVGGASYGALVGQRGGFITLGVAAEGRLPLTDILEVNSGIFVGAGGGRGGLQLAGGGLMLRYHLGTHVKTWLGDFGAGVSYIDFPDGTIHSAQPYISYEYPFTTLIASGHHELPEWEGARLGRGHQSEQEFMTVFRSYIIPTGVLSDSGTPQHSSMHLMGVEWNKYLDDNLFVKVESEGAMGGQSSGYMQILFGLGYRLEIMDGTWLKVSSSLGVAGGGNVATGGGLIIDGVVSLQQRLGDNLFAEVSGGYVKVPETTFKAYSLAGKLGYHFFTPNAYDEPIASSDLSGFEPQHFRIRATHQTYLKADPDWRSIFPDLNVDLLGIQLDYFPHSNFYLTGQGIAAYKGKAGAYMTGLVGAGVHLPMFNTPLFIEAEGLLGAAGGGGLAVGGGLVWQANAGLGYQLMDDFSLLAQYGYMRAPKGKFRAKVLSLAFGYNFTLFTK